MESDLANTPKNPRTPLRRGASEHKPTTPLTPIRKYNPLNIGKFTPNSFQPHNGNRFSMLKTVLNTPPSRYSKVINPFEAGLTERLHLPLICSPSLFHRPDTPQLSSTHFEWNIDEMSSLNPSNFEAHETQFTSTTDPDTDARAQAAISSFFNEQLIVPSPVDCPLRNHKIILSNESFGPKQTRDGMCQTELSLPPNLPKELEDLLEPYFSQTMDQQQSPVKDYDSIYRDASLVSLRRKLFEESATNISYSSVNETERHELELFSPTPCSPEINRTSIKTDNFDLGDVERRSLTTSINEKSFGALSPIQLTPIQAHSIKQNTSYDSPSSMYRSTPDRSMHRTSSTNSFSMFDDTKETSFAEIIIDTELEDRDMTMASFIPDEEHASYMQTPNRRVDRYSSRKNLSLSFSRFETLGYGNDEVLTPVDGNIVLTKTDSGFSDSDSKPKNYLNCPNNSAIQYVTQNMEVDKSSAKGGL